MAATVPGPDVCFPSLHRHASGHRLPGQWPISFITWEKPVLRLAAAKGLERSSVVVLHHSGHSRQGEGAVAASRQHSTARGVQPGDQPHVVQGKESKTDKRVLPETEGREEDLHLLILQNLCGWTLEGDASEQLEALFKQEQEDKLSDAMADVGAVSRTVEVQHDPQGRGSALRQLQGQGPQALRTLRSLRAKGCWKARPKPRRSLLSPPNSRTVTAIRSFLCVCGVRSLLTLRTQTTAATKNIYLCENF